MIMEVIMHLVTKKKKFMKPEITYYQCLHIRVLTERNKYKVLAITLHNNQVIYRVQKKSDNPISKTLYTNEFHKLNL